jgi:hypothetical protein
MHTSQRKLSQAQPVELTCLPPLWNHLKTRFPVSASGAGLSIHVPFAEFMFVE